MRTSIFALAAAVLAADAVTFIEPGAIAVGFQRDSQGNHILAASLPNARGGDVAVLRLDGTTGNILWRRVLGGTSADIATGLAIGPDGSIFVTGYTRSKDYPVTSGAYRTVFGPSQERMGFVTKLDSGGTIVFSTLLGSDGDSFADDIAVNRMGEAFVTGAALGEFPVTPGAIHTPLPGRQNRFVVRLNAAGSAAVYAASGFGGRRIAISEDNEAIVAGSFRVGEPFPLFPGAFQNSLAAGDGPCILIGRLGGLGCEHLFVARIHPTGSHITAATMLTGRFDDVPEALAIAANGSVLVAGSTRSASTFPVTPGAAQSKGLGPPDGAALLPEKSSGFFARLSGDLTRLEYSTYLSGHGDDAVSALEVRSDGSVMLAGVTESDDFPGLGASLPACRPYANRRSAFAVRFDDGAFSSTRVLLGNGLSVRAIDGSIEDAVRIAGSAPALDIDRAGGAFVATMPEGSVADACAQDSLGYSFRGPIAPGMFLTLYGDRAGGQGIRATIDGAEATVLHSDPSFVNLIVPQLRDVDRAAVRLELGGRQLFEMFFPAVPTAPGLLLRSRAAVRPCSWESQNGSFPQSAEARVFNEDGSENSCDAPARRGEEVSVMVHGAGFDAPAAEAALWTSAPVQVVAIEPVSGTPPGLWRVRLRVPPVAFQGPYFVSLSIGGTPVQSGLFAVRVR